MSRYRVTYKGELVAAGERAAAPWMMWSAVRLAPEFDAEKVLARLKAIRDEGGPNFETRGLEVFAFPPAFDVERDDALEGAPE